MAAVAASLQVVNRIFFSVDDAKFRNFFLMCNIRYFLYEKGSKGSEKGCFLWLLDRRFKYFPELFCCPLVERIPAFQAEHAFLPLACRLYAF